MTEGVAVGRRPGWARLRDWPRRHPLLADAAMAVAMLPLAGLHDGDRTGARWYLWATLGVLMILPLIWRRRFPMTVFGTIAAVAFVHWLFNRIMIADVALLVALYSVAAYADRLRGLIAWAVLEVGSLLAVLRWSQYRGLEPFAFLSAMAVAAFVLGRNVQTRRAYLASVEDRARRAEYERDQQAQLAAAAERARIAREMHDIVTHNLSVMIALADGAAFTAGGNPVAAEDAARQVSATGRQALTEMQRLLGVLREDDTEPMRTPQPGIEQLDVLAAQVRSAGLPTSLTLTGTPFRVPPTAQLVVYRVVQEALTNVLKHAESPTAARVTVRYQNPRLAVEIEDDGCGAQPRNGHGHGLDGMAERVAMFGGRVEAGPRAGGGWRVRATLGVG